MAQSPNIPICPGGLSLLLKTPNSSNHPVHHTGSFLNN